MSDALTRENAAALNAMAMSADRSNRPMWLVIAGALLIIIALIYSLTALTRHMSARERFAAGQIESEQADRLTREIETYQNARINLDQAFPRLAEIVPDFREILGEVEAQAKQRADERRERYLDIPVPSVTVNDKTERESLTNRQLNTTTIPVRFVFEDATGIFALLEAVDSHFVYKSTFIGSLEITPAGRQWNGTVTFARYEKAPDQ